MKMISVYLFDNISPLEELVNAIKGYFKLKVKCNRELFTICNNNTDAITVNISEFRLDFFVNEFSREDYTDLSLIINDLINNKLIKCEGYAIEEYGESVNENSLVLN